MKKPKVKKSRETVSLKYKKTKWFSTRKYSRKKTESFFPKTLFSCFYHERCRGAVVKEA
jgi:hypothetical protein